MLLSGCMVGPKYAKPTAPVAPNSKEADGWKDGDGWKPAQPEDSLLRGKWWELYGDTALDDLEEQVDPSNQSLKIAEANLRQARAAIRFNRASEAPTIGTSSKHQRRSCFRQQALFLLRPGEQRHRRFCLAF
jgi:outer membrane protein TolC